MEASFKAIADPSRRRILELVADDELTAGEIAEHFTVTRPAVSQHLSALKRAGLISERRQGTRRLYRARRQGFAAATLFLEGFWDQRLARLRRAADERPGAGEGHMTERLCVSREVVLAAPPGAVWRLLTDARLATRWMGRAAAFELAPGGVYRVEVVPGQVVTGTFVEIDPPRRLVHTWGWEGDAGADVSPGSTLVSYELIPIASGTLLRLVHQLLPSVSAAGSHSRGWGHYLKRLVTAAAGGMPGPDPWAADPERMRTELAS